VLRDAGISKKTQERYYNSVSLLCKEVVHVTSMEDMDDQISDWIEAQFHKGAPLNVVADALSGMHYFLPTTRRRLPGSWKLFSNWRKMEIPSRAPPLPEDLLWALMSKAVQAGHFDLASLLWLGFHCFLRTGELLSVRPMDLLLGDQTGIISLPVSKGRTRHNNKESVTITDQALLCLLHEMVIYKRERGLYRVPIWVHTGTAFRKALQELFNFFNVGHLQFRGYSLRRGGATAFYAKTGNMEQTLLRGRWASVSVARLYLCDALSQLPGLVASKRTKELVTVYRAFWST
jgi:integrase